jgi:hypothetical protein
VHRKFSDPLGKQRVGLLQGVSLKPWPPSRGFCLPEPQKKSAKRAAYISPASSAIRPLAPKLLCIPRAPKSSLFHQRWSNGLVAK